MKSFKEYVKLMENQKKRIGAVQLLDFSDEIQNLLDGIKEAEQQKNYMSKENPKDYHYFPSQEELIRSIENSKKLAQDKLATWKRIFGEDYPGTGDFEVVDQDGHWRDEQISIRNGEAERRRDQLYRQIYHPSDDAHQKMIDDFSSREPKRFPSKSELDFDPKML